MKLVSATLKRIVAMLVRLAVLSDRDSGLSTSYDPATDCEYEYEYEYRFAEYEWGIAGNSRYWARPPISNRTVDHGEASFQS